MTTLSITPATKLFVLTGAGISAESGIATFRDSNGLWEQHRVQDVASPEGFAANPTLVWRFYAQRRAQAGTVKPNPAHAALAGAERVCGDNFFLATQNVDNLHTAAGSVRVTHMHGELFKTRCSDEDCMTTPFEDYRHDFESGLPHCGCGALQRPHIVWFGEVPFELHQIKRKVQACDVFVCVGSSGVVYPAAGLVKEINHRKQNGERCRSVYVGLERPENAEEFDDIVLGKAGEVLPVLFG
jgi:NAD-dependent deacetylase